MLNQVLAVLRKPFLKRMSNLLFHDDQLGDVGEDHQVQLKEKKKTHCQDFSLDSCKEKHFIIWLNIKNFRTTISLIQFYKILYATIETLKDTSKRQKYFQIPAELHLNKFTFFKNYFKRINIF